jgi:hypothetical protein
VEAATAELPSVMEIGLSYQTPLNDASKLNWTGLFQNNNFSDDEYKLGGEFVYNDLFSLRAGYNYVANRPFDLFKIFARDPVHENIFTGANGWSLGAGVKTSLSDLDLSVNYAFKAAQFFGGNHAIDISLGF